MKTTTEIKAALKTIRERATTAGVDVLVSRSRRGVEPTVTFGPDWKVLTLDEALAALR